MTTAAAKIEARKLKMTYQEFLDWPEVQEMVRSAGLRLVFSYGKLV
jgi:hypothetical protein